MIAHIHHIHDKRVVNDKLSFREVLTQERLGEAVASRRGRAAACASDWVEACFTKSRKKCKLCVSFSVC
jgi:hypothetical protein